MGQLWFNTLGILHDGVGLVLCDYCPCEPPPSDSGSSSVIDSSSVVGSDSCTSSTCVTTTCCPNNPVPMFLNVTFTGGSCAGTYTMVWFADTNEWTSDDAPVTLRMTCEEFGWYLNVGDQAYSPVSVSCDPFELVFNVEADVFCGDFTITITG